MKLLIVDDSKAMRMIIRRALRHAEFGQHTVEEAVDGMDALEKLRAAPFDTVLLDWNMPRMNGLEVLQTIKSESLASHVGFITSEATDDVRRQAHDAGAEFLVVKPFTPESLREALPHLAKG